MSDPERRPEPGEPPSEDRANRILRSFLHEHTLWPVGLVLFLSLSSFGALILVFAIRLRGLVAGAALLALIFLTVWHLDPDIRARRLRPTSALLLALWAASAVAGWALDRLGAFG